MNVGWNLGNSLDTPTKGDKDLPIELYETLWGNPTTTREMIHAVKEAGFGVIRVPVTWAHHMDENGNVDKAWMDRVEEVVNYVLDEGIYCIINVHHDTGAAGWLRASGSKYEEERTKFENLWLQIATRFRDYDEKLIFEGFNEIMNDKNEWGVPEKEALDVVNKLNQLFVDTVRASGGNNYHRNLICNPYAASLIPVTLAKTKIPTDPAGKGHIILQVHTYAPSSYTESTTNKLSFFHKALLKIEVWLMGVTSNLKRVPVVLGEFGSYVKDNPENSYAYLKTIRNSANFHGILCIIWDDGGRYKIFDRNTLEWERGDFVKYLTN